MPLLAFAFAALIDAAMRAKQTQLLPELYDLKLAILFLLCRLNRFPTVSAAF